jgi:hypothetical protein
MGSPRSHSERPPWKASHLSAFRLGSYRPAVISLRKLARHSAHESGLVDMSALATRRKCELFTEKTNYISYCLYGIIIITLLQDRTRTVCDSLHVGRHSLRGIDG